MMDTVGNEYTTFADDGKPSTFKHACPLCPPERLPKAGILISGVSTICSECLDEVKAMLDERRTPLRAIRDQERGPA